MRALLLATFLTTATTVLGDGAPAPDYASQVAPVFQKYCVGCHNDDDREGDFSLESYSSLRQGTPHGPAFAAGRSAESRMFRQLTGALKPTMPPKGKPRPTEQ